jgi:hypothetical protein
VPDADEKDSELDGRGKLRNMGVVVEDGVVFDEFHETVEDEW